jgi:hypothetical protein
MRTRVEFEPPVEPPVKITLEMDAEEFAGLLALHNRYGSGSPDGLRGRIEKGLLAVLDALPDGAKARVERAMEASYRARTASVYDTVEKS